MQISHYRIVDFIGAGGMGVVLRAVDERLGRTVAVKVLSSRTDGDPDRELRLLREAQAASALNHPGIVTLHDVGTHQGRPFLVMEYIDGEPFSALVDRGIPLARALALCAEAADALAAAHQSGILHRDVKSDNLMLTADGRVKVLDFGLAKLVDVTAVAAAAGLRALADAAAAARDPAGVVPGDHLEDLLAATIGPESSTAAAVASGPTSADDRFPPTRDSHRWKQITGRPAGPEPVLAEAATVALASQPGSADSSAEASKLTVPSAGVDDGEVRSPISEQLTRIGEIIGTPAYMSPEQASGEPLGPKSEIFSLAVVAYELCTGRRPFTGSSTLREALDTVRRAEVMAPSKVAGDRKIPPVVDGLLLKALARDPADRYADMASFAAALRAAAARRSHRRGRIAKIAAIGVALATIGGIALWRLGGAVSDRTPSPAVAAPDPGAVAALRPHDVRRLTIDEGCEEFPTFSADGDHIIYDGASGADYALFRFDLASGEHHQLRRSSNWEFAPALSPDGTRLAFLSRGATGTTAMLTSADGAAPLRQIAEGRLRPTWSPDGRALWAGDSEHPRRWDLTTGQPTRSLTAPPAMQLLHLRELADGRVVGLPYPADASSTGKGLVLYPADADRFEWLAQFDNVEVLAVTADGAAVTSRRATVGTVELWRVPVDGGAPALIPGSVVAPSSGLDLHPASGRIAWSDCEIEQSLASLAAPTASAPQVAIPLSRGTWSDFEPMAVPGASRLIVISDRGGPTQLWEIDPAGVAPARALPTGGLVPSAVGVSPDGATIAFATTDGLYLVPRDGSAPPRQLAAGPSFLYPSFTRDGTALVFETVTDDDQPRIARLPLTGGEVRFLLDRRAMEPTTSPVADQVAFISVDRDDSEDGIPMLLDLATGKVTVAVAGLPGAWYHNLRFSPDGRRLLILRGGTFLLEIDLASGATLRSYNSGTTQFMGVTYLGDQIVIGRSIWKGDLWLGEGG